MRLVASCYYMWRRRFVTVQVVLVEVVFQVLQSACIWPEKVSELNATTTPTSCIVVSCTNIFHGLMIFVYMVLRNSKINQDYEYIYISLEYLHHIAKRTISLIFFQLLCFFKSCITLISVIYFKMILAVFVFNRIHLKSEIILVELDENYFKYNILYR